MDLLSSTSKVRTPVKTDFLKEVDAGHCRLIPDTADDLKSMLSSCLYHPIKVSDQVTTKTEFNSFACFELFNFHFFFKEEVIITGASFSFTVSLYLFINWQNICFSILKVLYN